MIASRYYGDSSRSRTSRNLTKAVICCTFATAIAAALILITEIELYFTLPGSSGSSLGQVTSSDGALDNQLTKRSFRNWYEDGTSAKLELAISGIGEMAYLRLCMSSASIPCVVLGTVIAAITPIGVLNTGGYVSSVWLEDGNKRNKRELRIGGAASNDDALQGIL